jgi:2-hydroxychromene-2-carboxylate isomerase
MLDVYIDFKSPAAYLAFKPTLRLADQYGIDINWLAVRTKQTPIPMAQPVEDRGTTHRRVRAVARQEMHLHYARIQGITMNFPPMPGNTDFALAVLHALEGDRTEFVQAAFTSYWVDNKDLNNSKIANSLAGSRQPALDVQNSLDAISAQVQDAGVIDAPAYVVQGELFIGREHLPWIETLITSHG